MFNFTDTSSYTKAYLTKEHLMHAILYKKEIPAKIINRKNCIPIHFDSTVYYLPCTIRGTNL